MTPTTPNANTNTEKLLRLPAPSLLSGLRSCGVRLSVRDGHLAYEAKRNIITGELLELLRTRKADLLDALKSQPEPKQKPREPLGQDVEDFIRERWPEAKEDIPREELPPTEKQREVLRKGNCFDIPKTRREASAKIKELIESGALCDFLSLAELEAFDRKAPNAQGRRRRFCCPLCGDNKPLDANHRSLSVDLADGLYYCHRCKTGGKLREFLGDAGTTRIFTHTAPTKEPTDDKWKKRVALALPIRSTPGATYLKRRGVPTDVAEVAGVKYGTWWRAGKHKYEPFNAVIFPIKDTSGKLVAACARAIVGADKRTKGDKSAGVFFATPGALNAQRVGVCEAPIDALILAACGFAAVALIGVTWPEWLPGALVGKDVALATDADQAGDDCARSLGSLLAGRATVWRLRPVGAKDWADLAQMSGLEAARVQIEAAGPKSANVSTLIPRDVRERLYAAGYSRAEVDAMAPDEARETAEAEGAWGNAA